MKKQSVKRKILFGATALALLIILGSWIFITFYFEGALNRYAIPRLTEAARVATHGKYHLTMGRISYSGGSVFTKKFVLVRVGYDSSEHGNVVKKLTIDSVRFIGVSWWDALWGNDMRMTSLEMTSPKLYMTNADKERESLKDLPTDTSEQTYSPPKNLPVISFDSIVLRDISLYLPERSHPEDLPSFEEIQLKLTKFLLDSKTLVAQPLLYSERVDFSMRRASYPLDDSEYSIEFRNIRGSFSDSSLAIDTFLYRPKYSKADHAARHRYVAPRLDFRCNNISVSGINFVTLISGTRLDFQTCLAGSWSLDFFSDRRRPDDPHPPNAMLPNDLVRAIKLPIRVDSFILDHGKMHWSERWGGTAEPGSLDFTNVRIAAYPFCTDTLDPLFGAPTKIAVKALFVGESQVQAIVSYALHAKAVNFDINATVGPFSAKRLNSQLIPNERLEVTDGTVTRGTISMKVRDGLAVTTVTPEYHDLSIKVLAKGPNESRGVMEWLKTLAANTFMLRSNNMNKEDAKAMSATTTLKRTRDQEFLQFAWLALRKSLGKVVGFK
ncbi:MAG: hypothetical protein Q8916_04865 [Bacteroidota bacterium]|nr:hypothetical protein [Bacteroidota bacterium]MDP4229719.1 hypothetical protein [Bacteroidota bacterium]MDP4235774.1 hypothetical protein [Bacteroidota bacterium]